MARLDREAEAIARRPARPALARRAVHRAARPARRARRRPSRPPRRAPRASRRAASARSTASPSCSAARSTTASSASPPARRWRTSGTSRSRAGPCARCATGCTGIGRYEAAAAHSAAGTGPRRWMPPDRASVIVPRSRCRAAAAGPRPFHSRPDAESSAAASPISGGRLAAVATGSYNGRMKHVSVKEAKDTPARLRFAPSRLASA